MNSNTINNGASSIGLEKMIIPSIFLHLAVIAFVITAPALYIERASPPRIYMVNLVSAPSEKPLGLGEQETDREVEKIESIEKITPAPIRKIAKEVPAAPLKKRVIREDSFTKKVSPDEIKDRELNKKIDEAINRLKEEDRDSNRKIEEAISRIKRDASVQGNVTAETNTPKGGGVIASGITGLRFKIYYTIIWGKIKESWVLPEGLIKNKEGLEAVISFKILRDGEIKDIKFEKTSGNAYFDKSVLRAVEKANPLPSLPVEHKGGYLDIGVRFHSSEL
ncbi:MAG: TonB family protein [Thermodesulfobacteriota bacterium]